MDAPLLTASQQRAYNAIAEGNTIFLTGAGGTGKSYLIEHIKNTLTDKKIAVTALTGCAAILLGNGAKTLHSWAGIGLAKESADVLISKIMKNTRAKRNWRKTDLLIIDEISMMSPVLFDKLETIARYIRNCPKPFGGLQLILAGDFFQLPPIDRPEGHVAPQFAFEAASWCDVVHTAIELDEVKRQSDPVFKDILSAARKGRLTPAHMDILTTRKGLDWKSQAIRPTLLFSRRADVDAVNEANLKSLAGPRYVYSPETVKSKDLLPIHVSDPAIKDAADHLDKNAPYQKECVLAEGAQVMLICNLDIAAGLVNGSRGVVTGFWGGGSCGLKYPTVMFRDGTVRHIAPFEWPIDDFPGFARAQVPLILAYAQTIHKSQGATLDCALIDIGRKTFEYGQAYVALSRVKSLDSLYIWDIDPAALKVNQKVIDFYESILPM